MNKTLTTPGRMRLDQLLVERGIFASRSRARDAILRRAVNISGTVVDKPGEMVALDAAIDVEDPASAYVSRAALKLLAGLDHFQFEAAGRTALDIGSSTGGFTQVLLERSASHVIAIDVGHGQMDARLSGDPRVTLLEGLNARELSAQHCGGRRVDAIACDVSFISIRLALPPALALAEPGSWAVLLVKPQFEVGRERIGKGGLLRDPDDGPRIAGELHSWLGAQPGWRALGVCPSPIEGGDGNREFLLGGIKA